jgi:Flp pilus assembly protein TadD
LDFAKNARKLDTEDPEIARIAGRIASKSNDSKDEQWGLSLLQESSQKRPGDATIAYDLAWAYFVQGRLGEAFETMKLAAANPSTAAAAKRFLDFQGFIDLARAAQNLPLIQQTLQRDPNYLPALAAQAAATQQSGDAAAAMKLWDQIASRWPAFSPALRNYSVLAAYQKPPDMAKALAVATRAREALPDDLELAKAFGILQYQAGDYNKAVRALASVASKRADDAYVQYYLGMSHYKLKQNTQSKAALQNAVRLQAKAPFIPDAQRVLAELK